MIKYQNGIKIYTCLIILASLYLFSCSTDTSNIRSTEEIEYKSNITLDYDIYDKKGKKLFSTHDRSVPSLTGYYPFSFTRWNTHELQMLDRHILGLKLWDTKTISLVSGQTEWKYDKKLIKKFKISDLKSVYKNIESAKKWDIIKWKIIVNINKLFVFLDFNHPLAWKNIDIEIIIVDIS